MNVGAIVVHPFCWFTMCFIAKHDNMKIGCSKLNFRNRPNSQNQKLHDAKKTLNSLLFSTFANECELAWSSSRLNTLQISLVVIIVGAHRNRCRWKAICAGRMSVKKRDITKLKQPYKTCAKPCKLMQWRLPTYTFLLIYHVFYN